VAMSAYLGVEGTKCQVRKLVGHQERRLTCRSVSPAVAKLKVSLGPLWVTTG